MPLRHLIFSAVLVMCGFAIGYASSLPDVWAAQQAARGAQADLDAVKGYIAGFRAVDLEMKTLTACEGKLP